MNHFSGKTHSEESRLKMSIKQKELWKNGFYKNRKRIKIWLDSFWKKVKKSADPNECWEWVGNIRPIKFIKPLGYGHFTIRINGELKNFSAHRLMYELIFGSIPEGLFVLHKCDNMVCVNPNHLFTGTQKDNIEDCVNKDRHVSNWPRRKNVLETS
jgi:hypothetical protein